ncbi:hypothetical protein M569_15695 [Genlisea aurea]|uniref:Outer envelope pore protein 24, chloroplastic n=1 Tax=Genlisea aurea TaxID=192259 RepID=S8BXJ6_9LAMI|nr:hypothetical protein M569_15695 [Genlisea aurea]
MPKASLKAKYDYDSAAATALCTVAFNAGDLKLKALITDGTVIEAPTLKGLALAVEKPGFFIVDYNVPKRDFRFQFMNTVKVAEKPLKLTYIHSKGDGTTTLDGALILDAANKISANHVLGTANNTKVKYTYVHEGLTTFEHGYDFKKNAWDFSISRRHVDDLFRATYQTSTKNLGFEWSRESKSGGTLKVSATVNTAEPGKIPKLFAESSMSFDF